jgi:hypothetical protein
MNRHSAILLILLLLPFSTVAAPGAEWLQKVPPSLSNWKDWKEIPPEAFFEVTASQLDTAEYWLTKNSFYVQDGMLNQFDRPDFKCPEQTIPYLIRAAYVHGGTGSFHLYLAGTSLVVSHGSLGPAASPKKSALLVCLKEAPMAVYSSLSTAL